MYRLLHNEVASFPYGLDDIICCKHTGFRAHLDDTTIYNFIALKLPVQLHAYIMTH